jgi:outer membrane protein assembly factor BamB
VDINRPAVKNGRVFVTNWPYQVTAYDAGTGTQRWQRELDEQMVLAPVATDDGLVVQTRTGVSLLDRADGTTLWDQSLDGNATDGAPAVADGRIFLADNQDSLHAIDLATGESLWSVEFAGETTPVVADGVVYAVEARNTLMAFDAASGQQRFTYEPEDYPVSTPIVGEGALYLSTSSGVLALEGSA